MGDDIYTITTEKFLEKFLKQSNYLGRVTDVHQLADKNACVVIPSKKWPWLVDELLSKGIDENKIFPIFQQPGNPWGYYDFWKDNLNALYITDDGIRIHFKIDGPAVTNRLFDIRSIIVKQADGRFAVDPNAFFPAYKSIIDPCMDKINHVVSHLSDNKSRNLYTNLLKWNLNETVEYYGVKIFMTPQYFDYVSLNEGDVILNCGIEAGQEIPFYMRMIGKTGKLHCVDPLGFDYLNDFVQPTVEYFGPQIIKHTYALSNQNGTLELASAIGGTDASIKPVKYNITGGFSKRVFPSITVDSLVEKSNLEKLDLIKMDLEGAEELVLPGTLEVMKKFRPQAAISIYHEPHHYWEIPLFFMKALDRYSYFIDVYSFGRYEIILYMIPNERLH